MSQVYMYLGSPGTSQGVPAKSQLHSLVPCLKCLMCTWDHLGQPWNVPAKSQLDNLVSCPRCPKCTWDQLGPPRKSQLKASYTALSHVLDIPCVYLGSPSTSQDVPAKSQLHRLVPRPICPVHTWDHQGHKRISQLRASCTTLPHVDVLDVPCVPGITWDIP